ncbi:glycoside hydrolase family 19 protein [Nocardia pseudovaccinii]|uniref:glycoside hydrolase family 19 protein n=1 Tax=Nocardia pseudovaccinii TaxID=189540 RepID=UPI0007A52A00|nr:glycoside hydrolase family 19 protein [Nocardia pseudovaccinii]
MGSQYDPISGDPWAGAQYGLLPPKGQKPTVSPIVAGARAQIDKLAAPPGVSETVRRAVEFARTAFRLMVDQLGTGNPSDIPDLTALLDAANLYDVANKSVVTAHYNTKSAELSELTAGLKERDAELSGKVGDVAGDNAKMAKEIRDEAQMLGLVLQAASLAVSARSGRLTASEEKSLLTDIVTRVLHVEKDFVDIIGTNSERAGQMSPVTLAQLEKIFPHTPESTLKKYLPYLDQAMRDYGIDTPKRAAAFLAQVGVETDNLKTLEEYGDKAYFERNYGTRKDLGNEQSGDGAIFHGRGALQLTGRANYRKASDALEVDFVKNPDLAEDPKYAFATAGWYWDSKDLNEDADKSDIDAITHTINGGSNGSAERNENYSRARKVLDAE